MVLIFSGPKPQIRGPPEENELVTVMETVTLNCSAKRGGSYEWFRSYTSSCKDDTTRTPFASGNKLYIVCVA